MLLDSLHGLEEPQDRGGRILIGYYGGKAKRGGKWITSLLPPVEPRQLYIETHAGLLGVLLQRDKASDEWINDLNERIVNWWLVARDRMDELMDKLRWTPYSESLFKQYCGSLDEGDDLTRAVKLTIVLNQGFLHGDGESGGWVRHYGGGGARARLAQVESIEQIRERIRELQVFNEPAVKMLDRVKDRSNAVIYVDPPYRNAGSTRPYHIDQQDYDETIDALVRQKGRVAVSGYKDDWDALLEHGWIRHEMMTTASVTTAKPGSKRPKRVEVLWTNYDPVSVNGSTALPEPQSAPLLL